ncbi:MAG: tRNA (adenosine(37)-N6)-dimethylallyltransferase MiaA [Planctomycetes bacterium]|nr:tRNA (adenosine(37)-N6)-dimethylallyltransferase MiaA [Planctomycetota bacterium]
MSIPLWILTGQTASGKSEVAPGIASELDAEIISADSMQVYRGMDIGTAKPSIEVRRQVPHHLIDILDPWESYSAGKYVKDAEQVIHEIVKRGKRSLVVGGTVLYIKSLIEGIFTGPQADWNLRKELERLSEERGTAYLYNMLKEADPQAASRLHPNDLRRITRALEVYEKTGKGISTFQSQWQRYVVVGAGLKPAPTIQKRRYIPTIVAIRRTKEDLHNRIEHRVERMFELGLLNEVRLLLENPNGLSREARQALGYKEVIEHLAGNYELEECKALIKKRTRLFAKRQMTWFRSFPCVHWVDVGEKESTESLLEKVKSLLRNLEV